MKQGWELRGVLINCLVSSYETCKYKFSWWLFFSGSTPNTTVLPVTFTFGLKTNKQISQNSHRRNTDWSGFATMTKPYCKQAIYHPLFVLQIASVISTTGITIRVVIYYLSLQMQDRILHQQTLPRISPLPSFLFLTRIFTQSDWTITDLGLCEQFSP